MHIWTVKLWVYSSTFEHNERHNEQQSTPEEHVEKFQQSMFRNQDEQQPKQWIIIQIRLAKVDQK